VLDAPSRHAIPGEELRHNQRTFSLLFLAALLACPGQVFAVSGFSFESGFEHPAVRWLETLQSDVERRLRLNSPRNPSMTLGSQLNFQLRDEGLHPFIEIRSHERELGLAQGSGESARSIDFWLGGRRIHGFGIKAVPLPSAQQNFSLAGNIPVLDEAAAEAALQRLGDWPDRDTALAVAQENLQPGSGKEDSEGNLVVSAAEPVFFPLGENLVPAWRFVLTAGGLPYEAISDDREILRFAPRFFDAIQASANVFETNKSLATKKDVYFEISDGKSNLENTHFKTSMKYPGQSRGSISGSKFDFADTTPQFREANLFAHANEHLDFLMAQGYRWTSASPITLRVGECVDTSCNCTAGQACSAKSNGYYLFVDDETNTPSINIGEGDGVLLKDLHFDTSVVSHEFGHHVVFSAITSYSSGSEALQLHEGLADFFVMMRLGTPCMGSGICTSSSRSMCYTSQCLRTAENELTLNSPAFLAGGDHQKGQLISGFLWDIKQSGVSYSDLTKIVLGAIDLLPPAATFGDFVSAIKTTDQTLFAAAHMDTIEQKILARNLDESAVSVVPATSDSGKKRKSSGNFFGCTVMANPQVFPPQGDSAEGPMHIGIYAHEPAGIPIGAAAKGSGFDISLALLLAVPLLIGARALTRRLRS
jgi:hypothetical protein